MCILANIYIYIYIYIYTYIILYIHILYICIYIYIYIYIYIFHFIFFTYTSLIFRSFDLKDLREYDNVQYTCFLELLTQIICTKISEWSKQTVLILAGPDISVSRKFLNKADLKEVTKVLKVHSPGCAYFAKQFSQVGKLWFKNSTVVDHIIKLLFILMETCVHKRQRQYKYQWYSQTNIVPVVTQGNGKAKSVKDFIFLFLWLVLIKRGTVSPKFPWVTQWWKSSPMTFFEL